MTDMMQLARRAVDEALAAGADRADARVVHVRGEELEVKNGALVRAAAPEEFGVCVRVLKGGCFGFAAAPIVSEGRDALARDLARKAVRTSDDLRPAVERPAVLAGAEGSIGEWTTPVEIDPFTVPLRAKLDLLREAEASLEGADEIVVRRASIGSRREEQWQASSEGAAIHQEFVRCGGGISATAAAHGEVQKRSYPAAFEGNYLSGGFEHVTELRLADEGPRVRDEAVALCSADPCPGGIRTLILGGSQLMLQIHESVGHPTELDRALGHEMDLAGSSFATTDKLGDYRYGSDIVNLVADSTVRGGLDTRGFDDECVPSQRWHVVRDGRFTGYHTSREWADRVGEGRSRGASRAEGWFHPPIIRITNLSLMPGEWTLEDLLADTEDGAVFADTVKMWSIDQRRSNFQFTCEIGWEVRGGTLGRMLRAPTYQGSTPTFWASCDAICDADHWKLWGVANCGKGNPIQIAEMSHGAAPARFRDVTFVGD